MRSDIQTGVIARTKTGLGSLLSRLRRDHRGVAAVEFAMVVPIMFIMFIGSIELSRALTVDRRIANSANASADLAARAPVAGLSTADVDALMLIVNQLMLPYDVTPLTVKIVSVKAVLVNGSTQILVDWSRDNHGNTPYARNSSYATLPVTSPPFLSAGQSVIVGEATYNYQPFVVSYFITSAINMKETFYLKPRNSSCVNLLPINCVTGATIAGK